MSLFKQLEDLRNEYEDRELTDSESDKLKGECYPGCNVEIHWKTEHGTKILDTGYVFVVDGMDADIGDCFVHIIQPDNPFVKKIVCK